MRTRGELSLTLSVLALVLMTVGSIMGISIARNRVTTDSNASATEPVSSSRWFTSNPGIACNAWLTCTSSGPEIIAVYLTQNDNKFELAGSDRNGQDYYKTVMSSCQGGDETISVQYNPKALSKMSATFIKSYKVDDNSIVLSINTGGGAKTKFFVYDIPEGFNRNAPANLQVRFKAKTAGQYTGIDQTTTIKGCEADGKPVEAQTSPNPDPESPDISDTMLVTFRKPQHISTRFGDAKTFAYEISACQGDEKPCPFVYTAETPIDNPEDIEIEIPKKDLKGNILKVVYSYKNSKGEKLANDYMVRHQPYFYISVINHSGTDGKCYNFPSSTNEFTCAKDFSDVSHFQLDVAFTTDIHVNMLGELPSDVVLKKFTVKTCDIDGYGIPGYGCYSHNFDLVRPTTTIESFPISNRTQVIKFIAQTSSGDIEIPIKNMTNPDIRSIKLDCKQASTYFSCIDEQPDNTIAKDYFFATPRKFELNLSDLKNAPPQPSTAPSVQPQPSPEPSPEPSPSPVVPSAPVPSGPPEIPVDLEFKMDMSAYNIDWAKLGIHNVRINIQVCDSDETFKNCLGPSREIHNHTYSAHGATGLEAGFSLKMTKGNKKMSIGVAYLNEKNTYINSSNYAPHVPIIKFEHFGHKLEYMKCPAVQGLELSCGFEVYDTRNSNEGSSITVTAQPQGLLIFGKAHSNLLPMGLVNTDDKIQVTSRVYNDETGGQPHFQSSSVILTNEDLVSGKDSRFYFPMIRYVRNGEPLTYEIDVEYIRGSITPKTPNIDWYTPYDEDKNLNCSTHVFSTPLDSQAHRLRCEIKPNTSLEKYMDINDQMLISVNKFIVEDGVASEYNPEGSAEFAQLFKELRSSDLNGDKVVSILDLTAVFDAYYATGNFPEDINNDNVVNIQDAMIVVSHLSESAP